MEIKLNLIPKYRKEEIAKSNLLKSVLRWELEISFILVGFFLLLASLNQILKINFDSQMNEIKINQNNEKFERSYSLNGEFKKINSKIILDKSIQKDQLYWSRLFEKLAKTIPEEISVSKIANKNYKIFIVGEAGTRDALLAMKENFSQEGCFSEISLPLSNLVSKDNVAFQIEFNVKEECVKNR